MAKVGISIKLDVTKIDKARLFKGEKGTYLDISGFVELDSEDQYGNNGFFVQQVSKEERQQGIQGNILGNSKVFYRETGKTANQAYQSSQAPQQAAQQAPPAMGSFEDDAPF